MVMAAMSPQTVKGPGAPAPPPAKRLHPTSWPASCCGETMNFNRIIKANKRNKTRRDSTCEV